MGNGKDQGYLADIAMALHEAMPDTLLAIGPQAAEVFADYCHVKPGCALTQLATGDWLEQVSTAGRFDFIFIAGVLEYLPKRDAGILLASLRDVHAMQLYALVPIGKAWLNHASFWEYNELIGFGMERVNIYAKNGLPLALLKFDLRTYKTTPEWFNSKYWARPELWDKY
ncbi:MAG: hypothetical protein IV108_05865 [Burkholderiales bacterium]|nr:hypothetical protein [Burkholderiales bacterium]